MSDTNSRDAQPPDATADTPPGEHGALWAHACDVLRSRLHGPEGAFPARWSVADGPAGDEIHLNELLPLCAAWSMLEGDVARDLVLSAVAIQHPDGSMPRRVRSDGYAPDTHAPWPLIAVAADLAAGDAPHPDFVATVLPALERHVEWTLAHHDPAASGRPRWRSRDESFLPDVWDSGLITVDLVAMLLAEIDALMSLAARSGTGGAVETRFRPILRKYERTLEEVLWDPAETAYRDRDETGTPISRVTLSPFMPLLFRRLPGDARGPLQARLLSGSPLGAEGGVPLWERWADDPSDPPVPAIHQAILWAALRGGHAGAPAARYRMRVLSRLAGEVDRTGRLPQDLGRETPAGAPVPASGSSAMAAAVAVAMLRSSTAADAAPGHVASWMERHRRGFAVAAAAAAACALVGIGAFSLQRRSMPGSSAEAILNMARECHRAGDHEQSIRLYREFLQGSADLNGTIRVLLGNALFRAGRYAEAEAEYRKALNEEVSSLHALYNLGLTLNRQERRSDAVYVLEEFVKAYGTDYPELAQRARTALDVIRTTTPPSAP
jgi:TolA-binding protein